MFDEVPIVVEPASDALPESLSVLKTALRVEHDTDDDYLEELLQAAADQVTTRTGRQVLTCSRRLGLCEWWSGSIDIPYPKLQSVTHVKYIDCNGDEQTLDPSNYSVCTSGQYGRVVIRGSTPSLDTDVEKPIGVTFVCGYGDEGTDVPSGLRLPIRELVRCWYEEKTPRDQFPPHIDALLDTFKLRKFWT